MTIFAAQSPCHSTSCSGTFIHTAEHGVNSSHLLSIQGRKCPQSHQHPSHLPCTSSSPYNHWTEWYLNPQVWLCFFLLHDVPGRSSSRCRGGHALGTVPNCREMAGALIFYVLMIFSLTVVNNEVGSGGAQGCQRIQLLPIFI